MFATNVRVQNDTVPYPPVIPRELLPALSTVFLYSHPELRYRLHCCEPAARRRSHRNPPTDASIRSEKRNPFSFQLRLAFRKHRSELLLFQFLRTHRRASECHGIILVHQRSSDVGRIFRTIKIKKTVEVTDNGKDNF